MKQASFASSGIMRGTSACRAKQGTPGAIFDIVSWAVAADGVIMPLAHPDLQTLRTPLVPRQRKFSANWSRALILGTLLFATLNSSWAQDTGALPQANLIRSTQTRQKSRFNGIMTAREQTLHICLSWSRRRRRIRPRNSVGYLFGNVTSQRRSTGTGGRHFL